MEDKKKRALKYDLHDQLNDFENFMRDLNDNEDQRLEIKKRVKMMQKAIDAI